MIDTNEVSILSQLFLKYVKKLEPDEKGNFNKSSSYKKAILSDVICVLSTGISFYELEQLIKSAGEDTVHYYKLSDYLIQEKKVNIQVPSYDSIQFNPEELIVLGKFYYHPLLQKIPPPPRYAMDENMEVVLVAIDDFFIEIVPSFTIDDLVDYFIKSTGNIDLNKKGYKTQFIKLLDKYPIDLLLYMLDVAIALGKDGDSERSIPAAPLFIADARIEREAATLLSLRQSSLKEVGVYGVRRKEI